MFYITNAFSLNMIEESLDYGEIIFGVVEDPVEFIRETETRHGKAVSAVGHADTAAVFSAVLETEVPAARTSVLLSTDDELLVGQYKGPRLPEGSTTLPPGSKIIWYHVVLDT